MLFQEYLVILRGGGDLATGVAYRLHAAGFPLLVLELPTPLAVRRQVSLATAVLEGQINVEGLQAKMVANFDTALPLAKKGLLPVLVSPDWPLDNQAMSASQPQEKVILVDARMAKRNIDTHRRQAPMVICLGPGFVAGEDCHAVIETKRGHRLGRVIWDGSAIADSGQPGEIAGHSRQRVLRAPISGSIQWQLAIGDMVEEGQLIGRLSGHEIRAPFHGVIRGLIPDGIPVKAGLKVGDVDPRADRAACYSISDKALSIGGGVLEAILTWLNNQPGTRGLNDG